MKFKQMSLTLAAALAFGLVGCSKNEPAALTTDDATKATEAAKAAEAAKAGAVKTAEAAKAEAAKAEAAKAEAAKAEAAKAEAAKAEAAKVEAATVEAATVEAARVEAARVEAARVEAARVEAAKAADTGKIQGLIDKAKGLIAESKFSDASTVLQQLTGQSLSGEQTKLVDALKQQIEKGLIAKSTESAVGIGGDLLKK